MTKQIEIKENFKELFEYHDGVLIWNKNLNNRYAGKIAGCKDHYGYHVVRINKKLYKSHRIIYWMHHGYCPDIIDHIDKNPGNNKIENLRGVSHKANMLNRNPNKGKTLPTGICWDKRRKKYKVMIGGINIGRYDELSKAIEIANNVRNEMLNKLIDG